MLRLQDPMVFEERLHEPDLAHYYENFDASDWLSDDRNVVLAEEGSIGVFEYNIPRVFTAHYMFRKHRGKDAKALSLDMLREMRHKYDAKVIRGIIEVENRASRWMTRQLGFTSYGIEETKVGPCEIFCMDLDERFKGDNE